MILADLLADVRFYAAVWGMLARRIPCRACASQAGVAMARADLECAVALYRVARANFERQARRSKGMSLYDGSWENGA